MQGQDQTGKTEAAGEGARTDPSFFTAIVVLSLSLGLVSQFIGHGVTLFLRAAGQPSGIVGLVYLALLPAILKVVWAPLVDRFGSSRLGHYRTWIIGTQLVMIASLAAMVVADPKLTPLLIIACVVVLSIAAASQDAALSGLMVLNLSVKDRPRGASLKGGGAAVAGIMVGGILVWASQRSGWATAAGTLLIAAVISSAVLLVIALDKGRGPRADRASLLSQFSILKNKGARQLLGIKVLVGMSLALSYGLKSLVLIDAGFSVAEAGLIGLLAGSAVGFIAIAIVRPLIERLGGYPVLAVLALLSAAFCTVFSVVFMGGLGKPSATVFVLIANALTYAMFPPSRSILLGYCDKSRAATEFAAFTSLEGVALLVCAGIGNSLADKVGFSSVLYVGAALSLIGGLRAWSIRS